MAGTMRFDYYYGIEAEQFSFYRVPRLLIKDERFKGLSSDAKLLYGLMLDRMALSVRNGWMDDENRAYIIYTVENIMDDLGCAKATCVKIMKELDSDNGIGLIEKKRRGLGKPDIIYVKNFSAAIEDGAAENDDKSGTFSEVQKLNFRKYKNQTSRGSETELQEVQNIDLRKYKNQTSGSSEAEPAEVQNADPNYTDISQTENNQNRDNQFKSLFRSGDAAKAGQRGRDIEAVKRDADGMDGVSAYMAVIRENIEYDHHMTYDSERNRELFEEIYQIICDVVCVPRKTIRIGKEDYPYELVRSRFLKLTSAHIDYVRGCLDETTTDIVNIKSYLITALYNATITINHYFQQKVQHDMYQWNGWPEGCPPAEQDS